MNSRQLQYAVLLSQVRNFSQVAEQLQITQPALSKQILSLEKELGIQLFNRSTNPLTLTPAGEHFIREAQDILYKEFELARAMERFRSGDTGRLTIGISPFRSLYLIPRITPKLKEKFPGVQICLRENPSHQLRKEVAEGKFDFAVLNLPVDDSFLDAIPIEPDVLVLVVPNRLLDRITAHPGGHLSQIDLADCQALPFITVTPVQEMRRLFDRLCSRAGFHPDIAMEVTGLSTAWTMAHEGIGATLLPLQFLGEDVRHPDVTLFTVRDNTFVRQPAVVTRRGQPLAPWAQYAIDLLTCPE